MSSVLGRLPANFDENWEVEGQNGEYTVFSEEKINIFPSYDLHPRRSCRRSVSGNTARLESITLNGSKRNHPSAGPIKRKFTRVTQNPFIKYKIPDEVIDYILSNLRKKDLLSAMSACKKFYTIGSLSNAWHTTDVMDRPVSEFSLASLAKRKIRVLRLAGVKPMLDLQLNNRQFGKSLLVASRLEFLDLSRANLTQRQLLILLKPCKSLQCLSLEGNILDDSIANCIAANKNLRELDISMTEGITERGALSIFHSCKQLVQLNASWCGASSEILAIIISNITGKMRKLNIAGSLREQGLTDEHIELLAKSAGNIQDLDLSDNTELGDCSVTTIMNQFPKLVVLSLNRCYGIDPNVMIHLNHKPSMCFLNVHGCINESNMEVFLDICKRLKINRQFFNFTAKPFSHGSSSSQIWGQCVLEEQ